MESSIILEGKASINNGKEPELKASLRGRGLDSS